MDIVLELSKKVLEIAELMANLNERIMELEETVKVLQHDKGDISDMREAIEAEILKQLKVGGLLDKR